MSLGEQDAAAIAEVRVRFTSRGVDGIQPVAAVEEDARGVPVAPVGNAPVLEAGRSRADRSTLVCSRIEGPAFRIRLGVEGSQWRLIEPLLPGKAGDPGKSGQDNRLTLEGMLYVIRTGTPWRDLPERFGKWYSVYQRFRRWKLAGVFDHIFESTHGLMDYRVVMVDGSFAKVHQHGMGARRNGETPPDSAMKQAIGRSRGGLTSKIMALTDANGRICRFSVVPGNAAEGRALPDLMAGVQTREVIGDKAYDSGAIRQMLADRNIVSTIPSLSNRKTIVWY